MTLHAEQIATVFWWLLLACLAAAYGGILLGIMGVVGLDHVARATVFGSLLGAISALAYFAAADVSLRRRARPVNRAAQSR